MPKAPDLLKRRQAAQSKLTKAQEMVRGSLIERFLPCSNASCQCHKKGPKHGPAYYLTVSYRGGRTRQIYVSKNLKPVVERWLENYQSVWAALEEISVINMELIRLKAIDSNENGSFSKKKVQ